MCFQLSVCGGFSCSVCARFSSTVRAGFSCSVSGLIRCSVCVGFSRSFNVQISCSVCVSSCFVCVKFSFIFMLGSAVLSLFCSDDLLVFLSSVFFLCRFSCSVSALVSFFFNLVLLFCFSWVQLAVLFVLSSAVLLCCGPT